MVHSIESGTSNLCILLYLLLKCQFIKFQKKCLQLSFCVVEYKKTSYMGEVMDNFFIDRIKGIPLTKGQERIARYMMENQYTICQRSLMDISKEAGVSDASVLRFTRAIGFEGYNDFKAALYAYLAEQAGANMGHSSLDLSSRLRSGTAHGENAFQDFLRVSLENIERSLSATSGDTYAHIASSLTASRNVYIFGNRAARSAAEHFARGLRYVKDSVIFLRHTNDVYPALYGAGSQDVLVYLCISRFYKTDVHICEAAKAAGMRLCLITNMAPSPVTKYADHILLARTDGTSYFNSMVGIFAVCEYLLTLIAERIPDAAQRLEAIDRYSEDERYTASGTRQKKNTQQDII